MNFEPHCIEMYSSNVLDGWRGGGAGEVFSVLWPCACHVFFSAVEMIVLCMGILTWPMYQNTGESKKSMRCRQCIGLYWCERGKPTSAQSNRVLKHEQPPHHG